MREIHVSEITEAINKLCIEANKQLPPALERRISDCKKAETNPLAKKLLGDLEKNLDAARELSVPICQDTGMAVVFVELGQEIHIVGGGLNDAIHQGVRLGYTQGLLRLSVVEDPLRRKNTGDNTPAIIHTTLTQGDQLKLTVAPKGFGSENLSQLKMFTPSATKEQIEDYVVSVAKAAGSNPCPPTVIGVGIGGDFELSAYLAKKALCRDLEQPNPDEFYAEMERSILDKINRLQIGPQGFGGDTTALSVHIETYPTHIAGLPVAVNIGCHVTRHRSAIL
ncbi:MAG: fumarate hydratase [Oscillospiraceae bacterium]|nr:fumarate hydratase [Oscillospiraceae bacterium]